jgi:exoribonuclease-2
LAADETGREIRLLNPGQIVEFIEANKIVAGLCLEDRKSRVRLLTEAQREASLSPTRILHVSHQRISLQQGREEAVRQLREQSDLRKHLSREIDIRALWEVLHEEDEPVSPAEMSELAFGESASDDRISAVLRAVLADRVYFKFHPQGIRANDPDTVDKILTQRDREKKKEQQILEGSRWLQALWSSKEVPPPKDKGEIVALLKDYAVYGKESAQARHTEQILRAAGLNHDQAAFQALVRLGIWSPHENLLIQRFGTRRTFPDEVLAEARSLQARPPDPAADPHREDLLSLELLTIDSPDTLDIDDGLSLEAHPHGYRVGIHIADVAAVVQPNSALDEEAALRATSIYLPEEIIPMLPPGVSDDLCSLRAGKVRPAISLLVQVDPEGQIQDRRFSLSWVQVSRRLSYDEIDRALLCADHPWQPLFSIARHWREERIQQGALLLPLPEVVVRLDRNGEIQVEQRDRESPSQILVSEMMIQANRLAAQFLQSRDVPAIYRCQGEPRERILDKPSSDLFLNYRQRKFLSRAELQLEPAFHSGLGVQDYTTVTSPIRRYLDLVVQRQLSAALRGAPSVYGPEDLETIMMQTETSLSQAAILEAWRLRYWLLRYLQERKGETTPALVLYQQGNRLQLLLVDYMIETSVPAAAFSQLREGQEIRVRIVRVRPLVDDLRVEPC